MKTGLSKAERETIISFGELDETANVYSTSPAMITKIKALGGKPDGAGYSVDVPKSYIQIKPPKKITSEHKKKLTAHLKQNSTTKKG